MPDVYGPFTGQTWTQGQWYRDAYAREQSGVYAAAAFTAATVGDLALTVSGLNITMAVGRAHVRGAGYERTGTAWTFAVPANTNATQARIDRLVLRRDLTAQTVVPTVIQGTPAATPTEPGLTQIEDGVWDLPLFSWTTPANSGAPLTNVVDERSPLYGAAPIPQVPVATAMTAAANWTLTSGGINPLTGGWAFLNIRFQRTTSALALPTSPPTGDIANTQVGTIVVPSLIPPAGAGLGAALVSGSTGRLAAGAIDTSGAVSIYAVAPGADIAINDQLTLQGYYRTTF
jgi:hypothetical protein